jgi:hypothetical protein
VFIERKASYRYKVDHNPLPLMGSTI